MNSGGMCVFSQQSSSFFNNLFFSHPPFSLTHIISPPQFLHPLPPNSSFPFLAPSSPCPLRLQRLEHLAAKFDHKATNIENWLQGKDAMLERSDDIAEANLAEAMVSLWLPYLF